MKSTFDKDFMYALLLIGVLGMLLLLFRKPIGEGFIGGPNAPFCDVDNPCPGHLKCINGFCAATDPKPLVDPNPVPLLPPGGPAPYF